MNAAEIISLVKKLGSTYEAIRDEGLIDGPAPHPLFKNDENEDLIHKPAPGIELWFQTETKVLERIVIALLSRVEGDPVYIGELPTPFTHKMDKRGIHNLLGEPWQSRGPVKLPLPIGITGGWDAFRLAQTMHPNAEVAVQYTGDEAATGLAFCLIDEVHD